MIIEKCFKNYPIPVDKDDFKDYSNIVFFLLKEGSYDFTPRFQILERLHTDKLNRPLVYKFSDDMTHLFYYGTSEQIDIMYNHWLKIKLEDKVNV